VRHLATARAALGLPRPPSTAAGTGLTPWWAVGTGGLGQLVGRTPGPFLPAGRGRELLHHGMCCPWPNSHFLQGVCCSESFTNPKPVKSDSHLCIKPFYTSLTAYEGHKISSNVIYVCFKAPLQSRDDLWGLGAHDRQALNI